VLRCVGSAGFAVALVALLGGPALGGPDSSAAPEEEPLEQVSKEVIESTAGEVIIVTGEAPDSPEPATYELTPDVVRRVPGSGNDALKALQTMPGVGRVPFGMGGLILRGTSPRDSRVYLDGIQVPLLYHFGGLASFYPSTLLDSLELSPGGYSVEYGRGQGGVVTLESRSSGGDRWRVGSELSMMDASARADGPTGRWGSWSMAVRRSYIDALLPLFTGDDHSITTAPKYWDGQLRYDADLWSGGHLTALLFGSDDVIALDYGVDQAKSFQFDTRFARAGLRLAHERGRTVFEIAPWIGVDRYHLASTFQTMTSKNNPYGGRAQVTTEAPRGSISLGADVSAGDFEVESQTVDGDEVTDIARAESYMNSAVWLEGLLRLSRGRLVIKPGLRMEHYGLADEVVVDPRLAVAEDLPRGFSLHQSVGIFHQPPGVADYLWGNDDLESSYSLQTSAGGGLEVGAGMSFALSGFYSELFNLAVDDPTADDDLFNNLETYKIGALASSREFIAEQFGTFSELANIGRGRTYGVEVMGKHVSPRAFAWLAYTLSRSWRRIGEGSDAERQRWVLDQPHVLTALGSLRLGSSWRVGARFRYASGSLVTPLIDRTLNAEEEWEPVFGAPNSERLPAFVQLDVRVDRDWVRPWGTITAFLDVQNATRRVNIEGRVYEDDYSGFESTSGLPLFPSFGIAYVPAAR